MSEFGKKWAQNFKTNPKFELKLVQNGDYGLILSVVKGITLIKPTIPVFTQQYNFFVSVFYR